MTATQKAVTFRPRGREKKIFKVGNFPFAANFKNLPPARGATGRSGKKRSAKADRGWMSTGEENSPLGSRGAEKKIIHNSEILRSPRTLKTSPRPGVRRGGREKNAVRRWTAGRYQPAKKIRPSDHGVAKKKYLPAQRDDRESMALRGLATPRGLGEGADFRCSPLK